VRSSVRALSSWRSNFDSGKKLFAYTNPADAGGAKGKRRVERDYEIAPVARGPFSRKSENKALLTPWKVEIRARGSQRERKDNKLGTSLTYCP
jgi:hypothetical protein